jgi:hypothetical protein
VAPCLSAFNRVRLLALADLGPVLNREFRRLASSFCGEMLVMGLSLKQWSVVRCPLSVVLRAWP